VHSQALRLRGAHVGAVRGGGGGSGAHDRYDGGGKEGFGCVQRSKAIERGRLAVGQWIGLLRKGSHQASG
jgi:hypothetical protein